LCRIYQNTNILAIRTGQELKTCLLDLRTPPFAHGHLYVALSRIRKYSDIAIFTNDEHVKNGIITTENVVYQELLKNLIA
jgi:hypothetical protein